MIVILLAVAGLLIGGLTAKRRKGSPADIAQYAVGYAIPFALVGLIITIIIEKSL